MNNISDTYKNEPKRYTASGDVVVRLDPKGELVLLSDYAALQAFTVILDRHEEIQYRSRAEFEEALKKSKAEVNRLKAEVERLRKAVENSDRESMSDEYDLNNQTRIINGLLRDKEQMQGKIERLTNAGDLLVFHYTSLGRKFFPEDPLPNSITNWNAAKEGKPSE